ncbi:MAG: hypothetical protein U1E40_01715 [Amaricoccus sp.]
MLFGGGGADVGAFPRELGMGGDRLHRLRQAGARRARRGPARDFVRTVYAHCDAAALPALDEAREALSASGSGVDVGGGHDGEADLRFSADMRYAGQSYEVEVPLEAG